MLKNADADSPVDRQSSLRTLESQKLRRIAESGWEWPVSGPHHYQPGGILLAPDLHGNYSSFYSHIEIHSIPLLFLTIDNLQW